MRLMINTAIGGDFLPAPDESTEWPQRFLVDWVRVYEPADNIDERVFTNGDFEVDGGTLTGWHAFGNRIGDEPNIVANHDAAKTGHASLKLSGQRSGGENYSGASQGFGVESGGRVTARLAALVRSPESLAGTSSRAYMKIEFYNNWGDFFGGPAMLGVEERLIADGTTPVDEWNVHEISADVPAGAVEARLSIVYAERADGPGAVRVDAVEFARVAD